MSNTIESTYVKDVYDKIGDKFSNSRHTVWPNVKKFIDALPENSRVLDAGCGNGKNMLIRKDSIDMIGCDLSQTLLDICKEKGLNVLQANIMELPFESNSFDAVICVAVLHHISTYERREKAVNELIRVVKPGGKVYIEVWAFEQEMTKKFIKVQSEDSSEKTDVEAEDKDFFVTWDNKYKRFYHLFDKDEMMRMFSHDTADIEYIKDNWVTILTKS